MHKLKSLIKYGNDKLPNTTIIFNMSSAKECPSFKLGYCKVRACYAKPPEVTYPKCKPYRDRQKDYWLNTHASEICRELSAIIKRKRIKLDLFRFNEAGDFHSQDCVDKLNVVAVMLKTVYGITTYGYSAREDLDFSRARFLVKSSGYDNGNNGRTIVFNPKTEKPPKDYYVCPCNCCVCTACSSILGLNIAFPEH